MPKQVPKVQSEKNRLSIGHSLQTGKAQSAIGAASRGDHPFAPRRRTVAGTRGDGAAPIRTDPGAMASAVAAGRTAGRPSIRLNAPASGPPVLCDPELPCGRPGQMHPLSRGCRRAEVRFQLRGDRPEGSVTQRDRAIDVASGRDLVARTALRETPAAGRVGLRHRGAIPRSKRGRLLSHGFPIVRSASSARTTGSSPVSLSTSTRLRGRSLFRHVVFLNATGSHRVA